MAGCSWYILAVGLLGCARTCQMAQQSSIARLGGTYRTAGTYRGQAGTPWPASTGPAGTPGTDQHFSSRHCRRPGPPTVVSRPGRLGAPASLRAVTPLPGVHRRPARGRYLPSRSLLIPLVMPAIPTNGLARSSGIILAIRIIPLSGVFSPNVTGITAACTKRWDHRDSP